MFAVPPMKPTEPDTHSWFLPFTPYGADEPDKVSDPRVPFESEYV